MNDEYRDQKLGLKLGAILGCSIFLLIVALVGYVFSHFLIKWW